VELLQQLSLCFGQLKLLQTNTPMFVVFLHDYKQLKGRTKFKSSANELRGAVPTSSNILNQRQQALRSALMMGLLMILLASVRSYIFISVNNYCQILWDSTLKTENHPNLMSSGSK
jgi:hypothetical protein